MVHDVDISGAKERYLEMHKNSSYNLIFPPIGLTCQGDEKVLFHDDFQQIISYDLKRDVFEMVLDKDFSTSNIFRYTPTNKR